MATFHERKAKDGTPRITVEVRLKGKRAAKTFRRITDARVWAKTKEAEILEGRFAGTAQGHKQSVGQMIDRYLDYELPKRNTDHQKFRTHLEWWRNKLGKTKLVDVCPQMITECRDVLLTETITKGTKQTQRQPATVVRYLATLSIVFSCAVKDWGWLERNPCQSVRKPAVNNAKDRYLSDKERERLLTACQDANHPYLYTLVLLGIYTGARYGELANLTWGQLDLKKRWMTLDKTKNGEKRRIPLTQDVATQLRQLKRQQVIHSALVFPRADGKAPLEMRKAWEKIVKQAKIKDFRFHDLRHTAASYFAMSGCSLLEIGDLLGHKTLTMVKRYSHLVDGHKQDLVDRMGEKFKALAGS
jgi:integrase